MPGLATAGRGGRLVGGMHQIRPMQPGDAAAAHALWSRTEGISLNSTDTPGGLARFLARNPGLSVVAESGGCLVGTALCGHDGRRAFLYHVAVDAGSRGTGLGRAMVEGCLARVRAEGIERVHVVVLASNDAGLRFWEHLGFGVRRELGLCTRLLS